MRERARVSVEREGLEGAIFRIEGMMDGLSLNGARTLTKELEERIAQHTAAYARTLALRRDEEAIRYRLTTPRARS